MCKEELEETLGSFRQTGRVTGYNQYGTVLEPLKQARNDLKKTKSLLHFRRFNSKIPHLNRFERNKRGSDGIFMKVDGQLAWRPGSRGGSGARGEPNGGNLLI
ncbi:hypothetical protein ES288_D10G119400v1 [Gossypium darwinii]|uniref:Uncharacterized protein n=2 Tax=Gossypium TaxID=3633 RepID=A0A5D2J4N6_GOSTO|nr:hypothetical protein ES288_D10G119400v1 [Gossypium darwinii]TYH49229.1 hypothetical protein ES332_D10G121600v1 [Gossypium tomentosum]